MERPFGSNTSRSPQQQLQGFPPDGQTWQNDGADKLFIRGITAREGVFEEEIASLDEKDADTAGRLLCWAANHNKHPDVIKRIAEKCGDFSTVTLQGLPPLLCAVTGGHAGVVKQLIAMGASVNAVSIISGDDVVPPTALQCAVGIDNLEMVRTLLAAGTEVNWADDMGRTALHHACSVEAVDIAVALLEHGADVYKADGNRKTSAHIAVAYNNCPLMKKLINSGNEAPAPVAAELLEECRGVKGKEEMFKLLVRSGWVPLHGGGIPLTGTPVFAARPASAAAATIIGDALREASRNGDTGLLKRLLSSGDDPSAQDAVGRTPLHLAAKSGHVEVVQMLLQAKAAPDARDKSGLTPVHVAAKVGEAPVVSALLQGGASPDLKDAKGLSALHIAMQTINRCPAVVKALVDGKASLNAGGEKGLTPLHAACQSGATSIVKILLDGGALPGHCWNDMLESPLLVACSTGHAEAVKLLLPKLSPRQINLRDRVIGGQEGGLTALVAAILFGDKKMDIVDALLEFQADPTIRTAASNESPLELAVMHEATANDSIVGPRLVRALIKAGAEVNEVGPLGCAPLHLACLHGACEEVVQALLDTGADACAPSAGIKFLTPLQLAGRGSSPGALRVMIGRPEYEGLDAVGAPPERATALACAVTYGQVEGVRFLLEEGADMDLLPFKEDGITPSAKSLVHLAMAEGHGEIITLLLQARKFKEESEKLARGGGAEIAPRL